MKHTENCTFKYAVVIPPRASCWFSPYALISRYSRCMKHSPLTRCYHAHLQVLRVCWGLTRETYHGLIMQALKDSVARELCKALDCLFHECYCQAIVTTCWISWFVTPFWFVRVCFSPSLVYAPCRSPESLHVWQRVLVCVLCTYVWTNNKGLFFQRGYTAYSSAYTLMNSYPLFPFVSVNTDAMNWPMCWIQPVSNLNSSYHYQSISDYRWNDLQ